MDLNMDTLIELLYAAPAALIAITFHEFSHGYVSYLQGDMTPKAEGRLSLNPLHHLDFWGTICLVFFHFGWAKPVQVNPGNYKNKKLGMVLVALAGPLMNFLLTFVGLFAAGLVIRFRGYYLSGISLYLYRFFEYLAVINVGLGVFNLIPIPPLDGSKVLCAVLPERLYFGYMKYERYGSIVMAVLIFLGVLTTPMNTVTNAILNGMWNRILIILGL